MCFFHKRIACGDLPFLILTYSFQLCEPAIFCAHFLLVLFPVWQAMPSHGLVHFYTARSHRAAGRLNLAQHQKLSVQHLVIISSGLQTPQTPGWYLFYLAFSLLSTLWSLMNASSIKKAVQDLPL